MKYNGGKSHLQNMRVSLSVKCLLQLYCLFSLKEENKYLLSFIIIIVCFMLVYHCLHLTLYLLNHGHFLYDFLQYISILFDYQNII